MISSIPDPYRHHGTSLRTRGSAILPETHCGSRSRNHWLCNCPAITEGWVSSRVSRRIFAGRSAHPIRIGVGRSRMACRWRHHPRSTIHPSGHPPYTAEDGPGGPGVRRERCQRTRVPRTKACPGLSHMGQDCGFQGMMRLGCWAQLKRSVQAKLTRLIVVISSVKCILVNTLLILTAPGPTRHSSQIQLSTCPI